MAFIYDLAELEYDLARETPVPESCYVICATPRSGSTLLAEGLYRTGELGVPIEYLALDSTQAYLFERWRCHTMDDYLDCLFRLRTTPNGVFGMKVHWMQLESFVAHVGGGDSPEPPLVREHRTLGRLFPRLRYVHIARDDNDRAAVSWWIASRTGKWSRTVDASATHPMPRYDFGAIDELRRKLDAMDGAWTRFFDINGVEPHRVSYEALVGSYEPTIRATAAALGRDPAVVSVPPPRLARQADERSAELLDRYRSDRLVGTVPR